MISEWKPNAGATYEQLVRLAAASGGTLPTEYLSFLRISNGGQGPLSVEPRWLVLDDTDFVLETLTNGAFAEFFPGLIVIGSNGASEGIAFDFRSKSGVEVVYFDMTNIEIGESFQPLAPSFTELLALAGATVR